MGESGEFFTEQFDFDQTDFDYAMGQRKFRRQTKEQEIYGIFAPDDDDDERPSFHQQLGKKRPKDTAPVTFVSGGVKVGSKTQLPDGTLGEEEDEITLEARPEKRGKPSFLQSTMPSTSGGVGSQVFAGMRSFNFHQKSGTADSGWIKSGRGGVVMQMMQKMGYEHGKGLGKSKQGIVEPVQAVARPGRGAVGAYGSEAKGPKFGESAGEAQARLGSADILDVEIVPQGGQWKKGVAGKKVKMQYKTLDDVINENESQRFGELAGAGAANLGKIIDMTGPEQKVYQDFSSFSRRARIPIADGERSKFNIPELTYNLSTLLDVTEEEICKTDRQIRQLKDQNEALKNEEKRITEEMDEGQHEISRLEDLESLISRFCSTSSSTSLDECEQLFIRLRRDYGPEYTMYGLDALAIPVVLPKIKSYFLNWDPLDPEQDSYGFSMMSDWKEVLGDTKGGALFRHFDKDSSTLTAFDHCIWYGWMPNIRRAALQWSPRSNGPVMISLIQLWGSILPNWILENLLEQVLIPKIKEQVDLWDPITDTVPIESWLLPWHDVMGDRLLLAYACIRQKIAKGLRNWFPGDRSAIESIRPWKDVFSVGTMQAFTGMNIVPKLERTLQSIDLSSTEHFEYLELFDWMDFIGSELIGKILTTSFFPRYYDYLRMQLSSPMLTMQELENIKKNYMNWKNILPQEILSQQTIMAELKRALILIGGAQGRLTGASIPGMGYHHQQPTMAPQPRPQFSVPPINASYVQLPPTSFKQLVESTAISNAIQFFPQRSRLQDGKQVYMFGDHSIYIDGTMLFCYNPPRRQWMPVSLNQLIEMSKT